MFAPNFNLEVNNLHLLLSHHIKKENKKMVKNIILKTTGLFIASFLAMSLSGCPQDTQENSEVKIGTILGLTGNYAEYGQKMQKGFQFALDEIHAEGGIKGKKVTLLTEDSQFDETKAASAYQKLNGIQGINIFVGITGSKNVLRISEESKGDDIVIIDPLGSAPKLTTHAGPNYFRIMASDALAGKYNVEWAIEDKMAKPLIVNIEDDWGGSYRDSIVEALQTKGFQNVPVHSFPAGTQDFKVEIEKIKQAAPDTIFLLLYAKDAASFMQQLRQAKIQAQIYGSDNVSSSEFTSTGKEIVEGTKVAMPAPVTGNLYDEFMQKYKSKTNEEADANILKSYDAMKLTAYVIEQVGEKPADIRAFITNPAFQYAGVTGDIAFDKNGDLVNQAYQRFIYRDGKLTLMTEKLKQ